MDDLRLDLRQALRSFAKNPAFSAVVVLTLALGIGANTAIFSLMDHVLVRQLPVKDPERLVLLDAPGLGFAHGPRSMSLPVPRSARVAALLHWCCRFARTQRANRRGSSWW